MSRRRGTQHLRRKPERDPWLLANYAGCETMLPRDVDYASKVLHDRLIERTGAHRLGPVSFRMIPSRKVSREDFDAVVVAARPADPRGGAPWPSAAERALRDHFGRHDLTDFLRTITRLQGRVAELEAGR